MEPSDNRKSLYGSEKKSKKDEEVGGRGMEEETKMEICLFSAVVSAALIFLIAYYFIYIKFNLAIQIKDKTSHIVNNCNRNIVRIHSEYSY